MNSIFIVRHCEADGQAPEASLTSEGLRQADRLADFLSGHAIDRIVSSPFERAQRSVAPLARSLGITVELDGRLAERILTDQAMPNWKEMLRRTFDEPELCYPGGESSREATNRGISVLNEIMEKEGRDAVVVSHGNLISLLLKHFNPDSGFKEWEVMSNPDLFQLSADGGRMSMKRIWADESRMLDGEPE
ncbi:MULTISPECIES: histidine phosphatase family protein [unclassified Paenibacillus]|uniref:histidine phosphatase family protein n=1 Tax=unclassified Paenibacillus TaxID=185978 RepID=UPI000954D557|nr:MULTISPECIES: histidine phosphatase family protein [unclassified Paenibacillus]ASS65493.1 histidine phosphatase family protein [Paenibacillus sp. RUD330]SIQ34312.1 2,3-bisphosphoglycerate-dependent phosphoglycerate mutase [Paenibacillus sp. RU4X]SIQ56083.1 2,3-bisphosphoglycerate-dependent phosphoglycerate mutase [Paenibacillus sp. RU4T]